MIEKVNLLSRFDQIQNSYQPKSVANVNESSIN
jgi:hypothetical protein